MMNGQNDVGRDKQGKRRISLVVPLYNEEAVLPQSYERMCAVMRALPYDYEIVYVDDGSHDRTWHLLNGIAQQDDCVKGIRFSRNFGHQAAVTAGMDAATGDALVIIDADLQDPPEVIPDMIAKWEEGYEVVYGLRAKREGESAFKLLTAALYYRALRALSAYEIPLDTGDFRLIDRKVADALGGMREHNRFLRGMAAWAGFSQTPVEYVRHSRAAGHTHYSIKKMIELAKNGVLGFSDKPLTVFAYLGVLVSAIAAIGLVSALVAVIAGARIAWTLAFWTLALLLGVVILGIGILGAYIARIHDEARARPLYLVRERINAP